MVLWKRYLIGLVVLIPIGNVSLFFFLIAEWLFKTYKMCAGCNAIQNVTAYFTDETAETFLIKSYSSVYLPNPFDFFFVSVMFLRWRYPHWSVSSAFKPKRSLEWCLLVHSWPGRFGSPALLGVGWGGRVGRVTGVCRSMYTHSFFTTGT